MIDRPDCPLHDEVGAWLLGALPADEARDFERHLRHCDACSQKVAELSPVIDALAQAPPPVAPPAGLRRRLLREVRRDARERRRRERERPLSWLGRRPALVAGLATALLVAGVVAGLTVDAGDEAERVRASVLVPGASAELVVDDSDGTLRVAGLENPPSDRVYQVWVKHPGGAPEPTDALFTTDDEGRASVDVPADLEGVEAVMVTSEPRGGSEAPTRSPIIIARPG